MTNAATANSLIGSMAAPPRPVAARTKLLLEGPILSTLLRLSAPNVLNLLAIAGMITFDGLFLGRLGPDALAGVSLAFPWVMLVQHTAASGMGGGISSAVGYAMGARLEYILIPLAFGFGTAIVAMVGTNWGAGQYRRARQIAWTGGVTAAAACATLGLLSALFPRLWMGLFSDDEEIIRLGTSYLRIVGPIYGFYGLGMALYFATQGFGRVVLTVTANAVRMIASAAGALIAVYWLDLGAIGFFIAVAAGFCAYAALTAGAVLRIEAPATTPQ